MPNKEWRIANLDWDRARCREYYYANKEKINAQQRARRAAQTDADREREAKKARIRYAKKPSLYRARSQRWRKAHPGKVAAYRRRYYEEHQEVLIAAMQERRWRIEEERL